MSATTTTMGGNQMYSRVTKMDRLNARVSKLLTVAVQEVLELVKETVSEYQEKTARTQRENERLRLRLREAVGRLENERAASDRRAQLASVFERAILQEQQQQLGDMPRRDSPPKQSAPPEEHQEEPVVMELTGAGGDVAEVVVEEEDRKLTSETLTECAVRVQLMFTDHGNRTVTDAATVATTADDDKMAAKPHVNDNRVIKRDVDAVPESQAHIATTTSSATTATSIPSPSKMTLSEVPIHPVAPECVKTEPASPSPPDVHQEATLSSFGLTNDQTPISPVRSLLTTSRTLSTSSTAAAGPYGLLFTSSPAVAQQPQQHHPQQPQQHQHHPNHQNHQQNHQQQQQQHHQGLGRRLGSGLGFLRGPRLSSGGDPLRRSHHLLHHHRQNAGTRRYDPQTCGVCGKTFSRIGNLRIHERCHTGEKPYGCTQCGRCFSQAGDLKKHQRVHTGEKPYYCAQCGKSFSRGENLRRHQKIHVGQRGRQLQPQQAWTGIRQAQL